MSGAVHALTPGLANPWADDALWAGPRIVERLKEQVPALRQVLLIDDIDPEAKELAGQVPGALVALGRMVPSAEASQRQRGVVVQSWVVFLVVRQVSRQPGANATTLGPLISQVVKALRGWQPGNTYAMTWQPGSAPGYGRNQSIFPLRFDLQVTAT